MEKYTVNRKQFHFLLNQFLAKHRLQQRWFNASMNFKRKNYSRRYIYDRYGISDDDNYSEHLYKCIDLYIGETIKHEFTSYNGHICGFFRFIPSGGVDDEDWLGFWKKYSDIWEQETYNIGYDENNS